MRIRQAPEGMDKYGKKRIEKSEPPIWNLCRRRPQHHQIAQMSHPHGQYKAMSPKQENRRKHWKKVWKKWKEHVNSMRSDRTANALPRCKSKCSTSVGIGLMT